MIMDCKRSGTHNLLTGVVFVRLKYMYKSPLTESIHDSGPYNLMIPCINGDGDSFCSLSHFFMILQVGSSDCSCFHCKSLIAAGSASMMVDAATAKLPLIACCACLDLQASLDL